MLKISVLDVGHGDFIYVVTPFGDNLVIDCGSGTIVPSVFLAKITSITELQISHLHTDHFDDILNLSSKTILSFRCPDIDFHSDTSIGWKKNDLDKLNRIKYLKNNIGADGTVVQTGNGFSYDVWRPGNATAENPNSASFVTVLSYNGFKMLFGGDLPDAGWINLLANSDFCKLISGTDIIKVPHHGRKEGCSPSLFNHISPKLSIISDKSLDKDNVNTCCTQWYTQRSRGCNVIGFTQQAKVLTTRTNGSIHIQVEPNGNWKVYPGTSWV